MRKIRILHGADFHLDTPFEGLPEDKAGKRRAGQRRLLGAMAELARAEKVDIILLSGDLFDSSSISYETEVSLIYALGSVACPVFIAPGNHDPYTDKSVYARDSIPDNVHVFSKNSVECVELNDIGVRVFGAAFTERNSKGMLQDFYAEKYEDAVNILCIHGEVGVKESRYDPISEDELKRSGIDYAALGHVHTASGLLKAGDTYYAWPGCPEGRGFDETGEKSVNIVEIDADTGEVELRTARISDKQYRIIKTDISDREPLLAIHEVLPEDTENDVCRLILTGSTDSAPDIPALESSLEDLFFHLQIRDETKLRQNIWESAGDGTLKGIFISKLRKKYEAAATDAERQKIERAARWGIAALSNMEEATEDDN